MNKYEINLIPNAAGGFYAQLPDFPTIFTGGKTAREALQNAQAAIELMIEELEANHEPVPEPKSSFSGRFNVRVPKELHRRLNRRAQEEGVSLNAVITYLLSQTVGEERTKRGHRRG
jgi:antitoxin HicB